MIKLYDGGVYLVNGTEIVEDGHEAHGGEFFQPFIHAMFKIILKYGLTLKPAQTQINHPIYLLL